MNLSRATVAFASSPWSVAVLGLEHDDEFADRFSTVRSLGEGPAPSHASKAVEVEHQDTGERFAAKIYRKADTSLDDIVTELEILSELVCRPNVVRLHAAYETPTSMIFVAELATGGRLLEHPGHRPDRTCPELLAIEHVSGICEGVAHMHAKGVAHCDLKPDNVMLFGPPDHLCVRIIGFGLAQTFTNEKRQMHRVCGTSAYYSPEMVECYRGAEYLSYGRVPGYDKAIDMWGVGLIAFILLFGSNPFERASERLMHDAIQQEDIRIHFPIDSNVSAAAKQCIRSLLTVSPEVRITAAAALESDWLRRRTRDKEERSGLGAAAA